MMQGFLDAGGKPQAAVVLGNALLAAGMDGRSGSPLLLGPLEAVQAFLAAGGTPDMAFMLGQVLLSEAGRRADLQIRSEAIMSALLTPMELRQIGQPRWPGVPWAWEPPRGVLERSGAVVRGNQFVGLGLDTYITSRHNVGFHGTGIDLAHLGIWGQAILAPERGRVVEVHQPTRFLTSEEREARARAQSTSERPVTRDDISERTRIANPNGQSHRGAAVVVIRHDDGRETVYRHMMDPNERLDAAYGDRGYGYLPKVGADIEAGGLVGYVGDTGAPNAPHLHLEERERVDIDRGSGFEFAGYLHHSPLAGLESRN